MKKDALWYLQSIDFFKDIDTNTLEKIKLKTTLKSFEKNSFIYFQDEKPSNIFFVKNGRVKIGTYSDEGREVIKTILENGEVFGEQFLLGNTTMENYAQAMEPSCLLVIERNEFQKIMEHNNFIALRMAKIFGRRLQKLEKKLDFIREMADETGKTVGYETLIMHSLTHLDIARITATSRQTVTTVLNELREDNQIYFDRKRILVRDLASLS